MRSLQPSESLITDGKDAAAEGDGSEAVAAGKSGFPDVGDTMGMVKAVKPESAKARRRWS